MEKSFDIFLTYILVVCFITAVVGVGAITVAIRNKLKSIEKINTGQSFKSSTIETVLDTVLGFIVSWLVMLFLIPIFFTEYKATVISSLGIAFVFTLTSFLRRFLTRRLFNFLHEIGMLK